MRGSLVAAFLLLACRPRAGARDERADPAVPSRDAPADHAERADGDDRTDTNDLPPPGWRVRALGDATLRALSARCEAAGDARRVAAPEVGEGFELVGEAPNDDRVAAVWDAPGSLGVTARYARTRVARAREGGVAAVLGSGTVDVEADAGRATPVRVDTPAGRLVVSVGRVRVRVEGGAYVEAWSRGADARFWRVVGEDARAEPLPLRGPRRWRTSGGDPRAATVLALDAAARSMARSGEPATARASLHLGVASACLLALRAPCGDLTARLDSLAAGLVARAR